MSTVAISMENFDTTIETNDIVLVDFWAPWCGPCRSFKPIFEKAAETHPEIVFATCNTEEQQDLAAAFQIRSIPTLMAFREKVLLYAQPGLHPAEALEDLIEKIKQLDMPTIHAEVAKQHEQQVGDSPR